MKILIGLLVTILFCFNVYGQRTKKNAPKTTSTIANKVTKCDLLLKDAPVLRGLRLGMTEEELINFFEVSDKKDLVYSYKRDSAVIDNYIEVSSIVFKKRKDYEDVYKLQLFFFDKKIYRIWFSYSTNSVSFDNAQQFAKRISETFDLPFTAWEYRDKINGELPCKEFQIGIRSSSNELILVDKMAEQMIEDREEQKRNIFKP